MFRLLTKRLRNWAAGILVAAYAFGVVAPSVAFSFDSDASIVHSLTEVHGGLLMPHLHHDHGGHENSGQRAPGGIHHCCGVLAIPDCLLRLTSTSLTKFARHWSLQCLETIMRLVARRGWIGLHDVSH